MNRDLTNGLSSQQKYEFCTLTQTVAKLQAVLEMQRDLPQVVLQKLVILLDACGMVGVFHLDFINSIEAFKAVMKVRFQQARVSTLGLRKEDRSEFILWNNPKELSLNKPWGAMFRPGQAVNMSMVFQCSVQVEFSPRCQESNIPSISGGHQILLHRGQKRLGALKLSTYLSAQAADQESCIPYRKNGQEIKVSPLTTVLQKSIRPQCD